MFCNCTLLNTQWVKFNFLYKPSNHPTIQPSNHPTIQPSNHQTIKPSNHPIIQPSNHPIIQQFKHLSIQPSNHPKNYFWSFANNSNNNKYLLTRFYLIFVNTILQKRNFRHEQKSNHLLLCNMKRKKKGSKSLSQTQIL